MGKGRDGGETTSGAAKDALGLERDPFLTAGERTPL
jgi:hypothetical protein